MLQVTATQARKIFFNLLDRATDGEKVIIKRHGVSLQLIRSPHKKSKKGSPIDYKPFIKSNVDKADSWTWEWNSHKGLTLKG